MPFQPDYKVPEGRKAYALPGIAREGWENIAVLMLHGFMGSPASSLTMEAAKGLGSDQVFIVGHSMGAVLGAHLADKFPNVCGLVLLAPLYEIPDRRLKVAAVGRYFMDWVYPLKYKMIDRDIFLGRVLDYDPTIDVDDPALQDWLVEASRIPVDGLDEMSKMAGIGRRLWPRVHQPVLIFQGGQDPAVSPGNTEKLFQALATADKEMKFFPQVGHELMRPVEPIHTKVWNKTLEFIEDHAEIGEKVPTSLKAPSLLVQRDER